MANVQEVLKEMLSIDGAKCVAVVDSASGMVLGKEGSGLDLDIASAGNTEVVRAKLNTMKALGLKEKIEDMLITLGSQYHIIRPLTEKPSVFIYLVLEKAKSNLAMARLKTADADAKMVI